MCRGRETSPLRRSQACPHMPLGCTGAPFVHPGSTAAQAQRGGRRPFCHFSRYSGALHTFPHLFPCARICEHRLWDCPRHRGHSSEQSWQGPHSLGLALLQGWWVLTGWGADCWALEGRERLGGEVLGRDCEDGWRETSQGFEDAPGRGVRGRSAQLGEKPESSLTGRWRTQGFTRGVPAVQGGEKGGVPRESVLGLRGGACVVGARDCSPVASVPRGHRGAGSCWRCEGS